MIDAIVCPFTRLTSREPLKESSACLRSLRGIRDYSHLRRFLSSTPLRTFLTSGTYFFTDQTLLLFPSKKCRSAPLCSCSGTGSRGNKNPDCHMAHRERRGLELDVPRSALSLAPRCCPFPASTAVPRLLMRYSRNAFPTIRHTPLASKPSPTPSSVAAASLPASAD